MYWHGCLAKAASWNGIKSALQACSTGATTRNTTPLSNPITLFCISVGYVSIIAILRLLIGSNRPAFAKGRVFVRTAAAHNILLAIASLAMHIFVSQGLMQSTKTGGFSRTVCIPRNEQLSSTLTNALYVFLISKLYELLDTVILVFRARPLSLLHVWHHASVIISVWGWLEYNVALGPIGMWINTLVHVFMYSYYAAALLGFKARAKILITMTQIIQFIISFLFLIPFFVVHLNSSTGCQGIPGLLISSFLNGSYLVLFLMFYRATYSGRPKQLSHRQYRPKLS